MPVLAAEGRVRISGLPESARPQRWGEIYSGDQHDRLDRR